jgi:excisionase family DNA binding protein
MHEYLLIPEVAEKLRITERTVRKLIKKGEIPSVSISRRIIRIPLDKLEEKFCASSVTKP